MRIRGLAVLALSVFMLGLAFYPQGAAENAKAPDADESTSVKLHFKGEGLTTASPASGNSTEETKNCPGRPWGGRMYGTIIGEWGFVPAGTFRVQGAFKAELWADSDTGAKNAGFRVNFYEGSTLVQDLYSDRADLSGPHKFTVSGSVSANCAAGVTVKVGLVWLSDPTRGVGPSGGGTFLYGSKDHDSNVVMTLTASPVTMNVTGVEKERDVLKVNARVNESLGMPPDALTYTLFIQGPATVAAEHISNPSVSAGDNGTSVSWHWSFRKSNAKSGLYTFSMTVAYSNESSYSNSTQVQISIEAAPVVDVLKDLTTGTNLMFMILTVVIVAFAVSAVTFIMIRRRRVKKARLKTEGAPAAAAV